MSVYEAANADFSAYYMIGKQKVFLVQKCEKSNWNSKPMRQSIITILNAYH